LELIPPKYSTDLVFTISKDNDYPHNDDFETMGYDTHNTLSNFGSIFFYMAGNILLILLVLIMSISSKSKNSKTYKYLKKMVIFNGILLVLYEGFIEIMISCILSFENAITITFSDKFSVVLAHLSFWVCSTFLPLLVLIMICQSEENQILL
jgi:hypothetical protein